MRRAAQGRNLNMRPRVLQREKEDVGSSSVRGLRERFWFDPGLRNRLINKVKQIIEERLEFRKVIELRFGI